MNSRRMLSTTRLRVGWVVLDDTNVRKNRSVLSDLAADTQYVCVWKTEERNGAAIFVKKDWHAQG